MFYRILWLLASKREGYSSYSRILFSLSAKQIRIIKQPPAGGCFIVFTRSTVPLRIPRSNRTGYPVSISVTFIFPCYLQYTAYGSVCRYWRIMRDARGHLPVFSCYARSYSSFSPDIVSSVLLKSVASEVSSTESLLPVYSA